ncbi:MAG TPA: hypothetical protein P5526_27675, partial [Anaerolineae bacterium]|nr:hypothetical protein [Anaerolineae bacterium]
MAENSHLAEEYIEKLGGKNTVWVDTIAPPTAEQAAQLASFANEGMKNSLLQGYTADLGPDATFWDKIGTKDGFHIAPVDEKTGQFRLENLTQTALPTLGGTIGAVIAPLEKEWLVGLDVKADAKDTIRVQMAKPGENLGPAGYKLSHNVKTDLKLYNEKVEDPLKVSGEALWIEKSKEIPSFAFDYKEEVNLENTMAELGNAPTGLTFAPSDTAKKLDMSGIDLDEMPPPTPVEKSVNPFTQLNPEEAHKGYSGPAPALIDAKVTFSGEYQLNVKVNVETEHILTVSRQDYERVKAELDGQTVYSASVAGSVTVWNPGADKDGNASELFVHVGLDKLELEGEIKPTVAMAKLLQDEKDGAGQQYIAELNGKAPPPINPYLQKAPAETMIAKANPTSTADDVRLAQASCNLVSDANLAIDGDPGPKTQSCVGTVLGDDYVADDWKKNAENLQEIVSLSPEAAEKGQVLATKTLNGEVKDFSKEAYETQAFLKAKEGIAFDGDIGRGTRAAALAHLDMENQPGIEAIAKAP